MGSQVAREDADTEWSILIRVSDHRCRRRRGAERVLAVLGKDICGRSRSGIQCVEHRPSECPVVGALFKYAHHAGDGFVDSIRARQSA